MPPLPLLLGLPAIAALFLGLTLRHTHGQDAYLLLPVLLAAVLAAPWPLRQHVAPLSSVASYLHTFRLSSILFPTALLALGHLTDLLLPSAIGLTLALHTLLSAYLPARHWQHRRYLLLLPLLALPWISLDFPSIGWFYRLSSATATAVTFQVLGLPVLQQGTTLSIIGLPITIEPACAGLHSLQALLAAGTLLTWSRFGSTTRSLVTLLSLPLLAWLANTARIIALCAAALQTSTQSIQGHPHELIGQASLLLTFTLGWFALTHLIQHSPPWEPASIQRWLGLAALALGTWHARDLATIWRASPYDLAAAPLFLVWLGLLWFLRPAHSTPSVAWMLGSLACGLLSHTASIHAFGHFALGLAACAWLGSQRLRTVAFLASASWLPLTSWLSTTAALPTSTLFAARVLWLALTAAYLLRQQHTPSTPFPLLLPLARLRHPLLAAGLLTSLTLSLLHPHTLPDDSARLTSALQALPNTYSHTPLPLAPQEAEVFGPANATKQLCTFHGERAVLLVIDGSLNRHAVHDPHYCFSGAGWQVTHEEHKPHPKGGHTTLVTLSRNGHSTQALYWWSDGTTRHTSPLLYWAQTALRRLTAGHSGPEPVLALVQPIRGQPLDWDHWLTDFPPFAQL